MADRWATFDCYGTLIDWNGGIRGQLARVFGEDAADGLLERYHELEPQIEAGAADARVPGGADRGDAPRSARPRARRTRSRASLPDWQPFPEVPRGARAGPRQRLAARDPLEHRPRLHRGLDRRASASPSTPSIVAGEIGSYKPAEGHWRAFEREAGRLPDVHVAASLFHDVAPATALGLPTVWINRLGEPPDPPPTRELPDLSRLPETLDELVPA